MCTVSLGDSSTEKNYDSGVNETTAKKKKKCSRSIPSPTEASECELSLVIKFSHLHYFHSLKSYDQNGPLQVENTPFNSSPFNYKAQYESANPDPPDGTFSTRHSIRSNSYRKR